MFRQKLPNLRQRETFAGVRYWPHIFGRRDPRRRPRGPRQQNQLWIAPVLGAVIAIVLACIALAIDHAVDWRGAPMPIFVGEPDTARDLLSIIGGAVATLLALIFTVIAVVIQLAIGHFSPRSLQILLGDRPTHFTIGVFVGTFTYALVIMLGLRFTIEEDVASGLSLTLAFGLAIVTIATFAVYSNHIIHSVRATSLINRIAAQCRQAIEAIHRPLPEGRDEEPRPHPGAPPARILAARAPGVLVDLDEIALIEMGDAGGLSFEILPPVGAFVPEGAPLVAVRGGDADNAAILAAITIEPQRSMLLDSTYGLRQLMDILARALSPSLNDPATAIQVLDALNDLLRRLAGRALADLSWRGRDGALRVAARGADWETVVLLTLDETRRAATGSMPVLRRLRAVLLDLKDAVPPVRRPVIERQIALLDAAAGEGFSAEYDRDLARRADPRGIGM